MDANGQQTRSKFDAANRLIEQIDATRTNRYDAQGRLAKIREGGNAASYTCAGASKFKLSPTGC